MSLIRYEYDAGRIAMAHDACHASFEAAVQQWTDVIVVDNTHVSRWEYESYEREAVKNAYE